MQKELWTNAQVVLSTDLSYTETTRSNAITERWLDFNNYGVIANSQTNSETLPFEIISASNTTITIKTGTAITPAGERIIVVVGDTYAFDATNPSHTPPTSTGVVGVPLWSTGLGAVNYVWISYIQAADPTYFTLQEGTSTPLYVHGVDGYAVEITGSPTNPGKLLAGTVTILVAGGSSVAISYTLRPIAALKVNRAKIVVGGTPPVAYSAATDNLFLDDHINAVGTGTVGPTNPHGLTPEDIGLTVIEGVNHQSRLHSTGLYTDVRNTTASAWYMDAVRAVGSNADYCTIKALATNEQAVISGITINSLDLTSDTTFDFDPTVQTTGYYLMYADSADKTIKRSGPYTSDIGDSGSTFADATFTAMIADITLMALWSVYYSSDGVDGDLTPETAKDWRSFGNTGTLNIKPYITSCISSGMSPENKTTTLYSARIIGTGASYAYAVNTLTLTGVIDGVTSGVTFSGTDPLSVTEIIDEINTDMTGIYARLDSNLNIRLLANTTISGISGTAAATLGLADTPEGTDTLLKEVIIAGDTPGYQIMAYDGINRISTVTGYIGNKTLTQTITYISGDTFANIASIVETVAYP